MKREDNVRVLKKVQPRTLLVFAVALSLAAGFFAYQPFWGKISGARPWLLGLDVAGGSYLVYEIDLKEVPEAERGAVINGLRDVIEKRVNLFGVSEPRVYPAKSGERTRLVVELAGVKDTSRAIEEIGATPFLEFRELLGSSTVPKEAIAEDSKEKDLETYTFVSTPLNGRYVKGAQAGFDPATSRPEIYLEFNSEGAAIFGAITEKNIGKPIAIYVDEQPIQVATVSEKIDTGNARITGVASIEDARKFIERFNAGALPAPIKLVNQTTVSAELGADSLRRAIVAGAVGTLLVIIFMVIYYRVRGLYAAAALLMYIALTLAAFKLIPITMTLAGIAGFILSIGMAVDANILVFERTKEELKRGVPEVTATEEGFRRAWTSIRDSNISTMITSIVLYYFTSSFVRGFALTLLIGVVVSMFSAITITRTIMRVAARRHQTTTP